MTFLNRKRNPNPNRRPMSSQRQFTHFNQNQEEVEISDWKSGQSDLWGWVEINRSLPKKTLQLSLESQAALAKENIGRAQA